MSIDSNYKTDATEPVNLGKRTGSGRRKHKTNVDSTAISEATRADILSGAEQEFAAQGFEGTSIVEIARCTNTSKRMIYYHFGNKQNLYRAVLKRAYISLRSRSVFPGIERLPPIDGLKEYAKCTFDSHLLNPNLVRLSAHENISRGETLNTLREDLSVYPTSFEPLSAILERGLSEGVFRPGLRFMDVYLIIVGISFHTISNHHSIKAIFQHDMLSDHEIVARRNMLVDLICRYVAAPDRPTRLQAAEPSND